MTDPEVFLPGPQTRTVRRGDGQVIAVPSGWILLPPGDAALTRRVKAAGEYWSVQEKVGRKVFSRGIWAPEGLIQKLRDELLLERTGDKFQKRQEAARRRRHRAQDEYVAEFQAAVFSFLAFHPGYQKLAEQITQAITRHATPVGSGTVARTERIPIEKRAEAAVLAWMRHKTTAYDSMSIPRVKGQRRVVRRKLAAMSRDLLEVYRRGDPLSPSCPLQTVLADEQA